MQPLKIATLSLALLVLPQAALATAHTAGSEIHQVNTPPASSEEKMKRLVGKWYGERPAKNGGTRYELMERAADGSYVVEFLTKGKDGSEKRQVEVGRWGISGETYFSIFRGWIINGHFSPADPADPRNYDAYQILELGKKLFRYRHESSGSEFTLEKVKPNFSLAK